MRKPMPIAMVATAIFALANCAKADIDSAQEQYDAEWNLRGIVIHNPTAAIGEGEKQVKTPWMIMTPDGKSAFANDFTTNAISVVSENGTDYYAHIEGENGDRTKVIHFTVNENGIPSKNGDVIDTTESGEENNAEKMKIRKVIAVKDGYLCFYPTDEYGTSFIYNPEYNRYSNDKLTEQKLLASSKTEYGSFGISNRHYTNSEGKIETETMIIELSEYSYVRMPMDPLSDENKVMYYDGGSMVAYGDTEGNVVPPLHRNVENAKLPGRISSISMSEGDFLVTSTATNAFYNLNLGQYNVAMDQNGNVKPMIPKTKDGLIKVIDNRRNGGKFLCITTKGAHTIDD